MRSFLLQPKSLLIALTLIVASSASAQEYRTMADTPALNKKYAALSLEVAKLQSKLVEAQNKTAQYQKETDQAKIDAAKSAQNSMDKAQTATSGNTDDTRNAVKEAKRADKRARQAKKADEKEKENQVNIGKLNDQIAKKQATLAALDAQKATILGTAPVVNSALPDANTPAVSSDSTSR